MHVVRHDPSEAPLNTAPVVTGAVHIRPLVGEAQTAELIAYHVTFEPGGRNLPHSHSFDQVLYILAGEGIVGNGDGEERVRPGDMVVVPAGEEHWHGATGTTAMSHLAVGVPGETWVDGELYVPPS